MDSLQTSINANYECSDARTNLGVFDKPLRSMKNICNAKTIVTIGRALLTTYFEKKEKTDQQDQLTHEMNDTNNMVIRKDLNCARRQEASGIRAREQNSESKQREAMRAESPAVRCRSGRSGAVGTVRSSATRCA